MIELLNLEPLNRRVESTALFIGFAEIIPHDSFFDIFDGSEILDDVAAGVVEKDIAFVVAANGDQPLQLVSVFEQIIDRLVGAFAGDDGYFGFGGLSCLGHAVPS